MDWISDPGLDSTWVWCWIAVMVFRQPLAVEELMVPIIQYQSFSIS